MKNVVRFHAGRLRDRSLTEEPGLSNPLMAVRFCPILLKYFDLLEGLEPPS